MSRWDADDTIFRGREMPKEKSEAFLNESGGLDKIKELSKEGWVLSEESFSYDESDEVISADVRLKNMFGGRRGTLKIRLNPSASSEKYSVTFEPF